MSYFEPTLKENDVVSIVMGIAKQLNDLDSISTGSEIKGLMYDLSRLCSKVLGECGSLSADCVKTVFRKNYGKLETVLDQGNVGITEFGYNDGHIDTANVVRIFVDFEDEVSLPLRFSDVEYFTGKVKGECFFECILDDCEIVDVFEDGDFVGSLDFDKIN